MSRYECVLFSIILSCFKNVKSLNLGRNCIGVINTKHIVQGIKKYTHLKELVLRGIIHYYYLAMLFNFTSFNILSNILKRNENLEYLNLRVTRSFYINSLPINKWNDGMKEVLNSCPNLTRLNIKCILLINTYL